MKRIFYILFGVVLGAVGVAYLLNKRLHDVEARLHVHEERQRTLNEGLRAKNKEREQQERAYVASLSPEKKLEYEMKEALYRSQYPDLFSDKKEDDNA